ncbi:MAG: Smr/MutS family protein, partial [Candidatus Cloacimonadota bacterium]|nr:Smr/MutS family protein [Candidatus Cloacimonadota bacterium]
IKKLDIKNKKEKTEKLLNSVVNKNQHFKKKENILTNSKKKLIENPKIGDSVWVEDLDSEGNIVEISNNQIKIDLDGFYFTTNKSKVFQTKAKKQKQIISSKKVVSSSDKRASTEIKLLGFTFDEARLKLDDFIDDAFLAGLNKIRIVHGKGTGALRRKIRIYLKSNKRIKEFYSPAPEAGGDGVTVVSFS